MLTFDVSVAGNRTFYSAFIASVGFPCEMVSTVPFVEPGGGMHRTPEDQQASRIVAQRYIREGL